jgi:hypothetical protein
MFKKAAVIFVLLVAGPLGFAVATGDVGAVISTISDNPGASHEKVTLCHHTGSATNPYVEITVNFNSIEDAKSAKGHLEHDGDIIPPYTYTDPQGTFSFPGQGDQDVLANGCNPVVTTTTTTTTTPTTTTTETTPTTTTTTTTPTPTTTTTTTTGTTTETTGTTTVGTTTTTPATTTVGTPTTPATPKKPAAPKAKPKPPARKHTKTCPAPAYLKNGQCFRDFQGNPHPVAPAQG